jgi:hypothetical protein
MIIQLHDVKNVYNLEKMKAAIHYKTDKIGFSKCYLNMQYKMIKILPRELILTLSNEFKEVEDKTKEKLH